jgi:TFIIF-interacting CTD phosphatase-like protein
LFLAIPIPSYLGDKSDDHLLSILKLLSTLKDVADVRPILKETFQFRRALTKHKIKMPPEQQ